MDYGHKATDDELKKLEQRISREYQQAYKEISEKCDKYFKSFEAKDAKMLEKVANGLMSEQDYKTWRYNQTMTGEKWVALKNSIASDMVQTDEMAMALVNNTLPDIYALNYNFGTYEIEKGLNASTSFTLVDRDTVQRMMSDNPDIFPKPTLNKIKDGIWNRQHITSAVAQGILQGESMQGIAKRLLSVTNMDKVAAIRNARTYTTSAENGGRMDSYRRAEDMGIKMRKMWISTQDERTRESHRELDRIVVDTEEEFPNKLMYPADPSGDPSEVYNCRCTMVAVLKGHEYKDVDYRDKADYEKWKKGKEKEQKAEETESKEPAYTTKGITEPQRPNSSDFGDRDAYDEARAKYRQEREEYKKQMDEIVEKAVNYERFNTKDDVKEWAKAQGIAVKDEVLNNVDLRAFNEASVALDEMFEKFPEVKNYKIEDFDGNIFQREFWIGSTKDGLLSANGGFNYNIDYFKNYEIGVSDALTGQTNGFFVAGDGTFSALVRHEYGHNVQDYIESQMALKYHYHNPNWRENFSTFDEMKKAHDAYHTERKQYESELLALANLKGASEYSNTNIMELFAEGFSEYTSGGDTEFGIKFGEFLKRWY